MGSVCPRHAKYVRGIGSLMKYIAALNGVNQCSKERVWKDMTLHGVRGW